MFCVVYQLCRVRGAKAVVRQMPHEAGELEPVIHALQAQVNETRRPHRPCHPTPATSLSFLRAL